jgi:hypothetical protein
MLKQVFHPYWVWEDYINGMWRKESKEFELQWLPIAITFTGDHNKYGAAMIRVINEWPISCEHNLTDKSQNRRAWIGHAAVCLELGIPEYITRMAWHHLTEKQQIKANRKADIAIEKWETTKAKNYAQTEIRF